LYNIRLALKVFLKLLLAFAALIGAVQFFRLLLLPGLQSLFHPGDSVTSLLRRTGIFVFAVLAYWAYVRFFEKRKASELRPSPLPIAMGAGSGSLLIAVSMLPLFAFGVYEMTAFRGLQSGLLGVAGLIWIAAFLEEIAYRCILFRILENAWGTIPALLLQSLIFALEHLENLEGRAGTRELVTMVVAATLTGAFWTMVFVHSRNLWVATANHAAWNFTILLSGLPLSGIEDWRNISPMASNYRGPAWLTGGLFGPETSIVTMVMLTISLAAMLYWAKKKNRLIRGEAQRVDPPELPQAEARLA
jgi:membrane protease YdiL (CAAX protease family)